MISKVGGASGPLYGTAFLRPEGKAYLEKDFAALLETIAMQSGRAQVSNFIQRPAEPFVGELKQGQLQVLPLNRADKARRGSAGPPIRDPGYFAVARTGAPDLQRTPPLRGALRCIRGTQASLRLICTYLPLAATPESG